MDLIISAGSFIGSLLIGLFLIFPGILAFFHIGMVFAFFISLGAIIMLYFLIVAGIERMVREISAVRRR